MWLDGLSFPIKNPIIWTVKLAYKYKFETSKPEDLFISNTIPNKQYMELKCKSHVFKFQRVKNNN